MNYAISTNLVRENYVKKKKFLEFRLYFALRFSEDDSFTKHFLFFAVKIGVKHLLKKIFIYNGPLQLLCTTNYDLPFHEQMEL